MIGFAFLGGLVNFSYNIDITEQWSPLGSFTRASYDVDVSACLPSVSSVVSLLIRHPSLVSQIEEA